MVTKQCYTCQQHLLLSEFYNDKRKSQGVSSNCKSCRNKYHRDYYLKNKESYLKKAKIHRAEHRKRNLEKINEYKMKYGCASCPEKDPVCLDFHHHVGEKEFNIAQGSSWFSWKNILKEINKCVVICSNCHRKLHAKERELAKSES